MKTKLSLLIPLFFWAIQLKSQAFIDGGANLCTHYTSYADEHLFSWSLGAGVDIPFKEHSRFSWTNSIHYTPWINSEDYSSNKSSYKAEYLILNSGILLRTGRERPGRFVIALSPVLSYQFRLGRDVEYSDSPGKTVHIKLDPAGEHTRQWNVGFLAEFGYEYTLGKQRLSLRFLAQPLYFSQIKVRGAIRAVDNSWVGTKLVYTPHLKINSR